jgi:hypothetical protein
MDQQFPEIRNKIVTSATKKTCKIERIAIGQASLSIIDVEKEKIIENPHILKSSLQKNIQGNLTR